MILQISLYRLAAFLLQRTPIGCRLLVTPHMSKPASFTSAHDQSATLRQLKLLVVLLVISNVGLGLFAFYLLRSTDARYTEILSRSIPALSDLRGVSFRLTDLMRSTSLPLLTSTEEQRPQAIRRAQAAIAADRELREKLLLEIWLIGSADNRSAIQRAGDKVDTIAIRVIEIVQAGNIAEATKFRDQTLRPAFDEYLESIGKAADAVEDASLKANDDISARISSMSAVVLGIAGWPVIVLIALLVLTAVFVVVLMVLFRAREMSDMP
jgi:hypothetical protein